MKKPENQLKNVVNSVPISVEFNFTKRLEGRDLKAGEFTFELKKDSVDVVIATATNDASKDFILSCVDSNKAGEKLQPRIQEGSK